MDIRLSKYTLPVTCSTGDLVISMAMRNNFIMKLALAAYLLFCPAAVFGFSLSGVIVDEESEVPVELAHIEASDVRNNAKFNVYADSLGRFSFDNDVDIDSCRLIVTAFNYEPFSGTVKCRDARPLNIRLKQKSNQLGEVTVTAEQVKRIDGGYRIIPSKNQVKHAFGGYGLLYNLMIPGVNVDQISGTVTALGSDTKLYINGVEASFREVQSLRAKDVARVEYYDTPKGEYAMDRTAINIILKERDSGGYVDAVARQTIGFAKGDLDLTAKFFNGNTRYTVFGGANYGAYMGGDTYACDTIDFPEERLVRSRATELGKLRSNSEYLQFQVQNANKKRTLRGDLIFNRDATPVNRTAGSTSYSRAGLEDLATSSETSSEANTGTIKLFGNFNFSDKHHFQATVIARLGRNTYNYLYSQAQADGVRSDVKEDNYSQRVNMRYLWNINKKHTLAARAEFNNMLSDADYSGNIANTQHTRSTDGRIMLSWQFNSGKWSTNLMPGINISEYYVEGNKKNRKVLPRLTASAQYQPHNNDFIFMEAMVGTAAPPVSWLTGAMQMVDPVEIKVGNPMMSQTKSYMGTIVYGIGLSKINLQCFARYVFQDDSPAYVYSIEDHYLLRRMSSDADFHLFVTSLDATWRPSNKLSLSANVGYSYQRDKIPGEEAPKASNILYGIRAAYYIGNVAINARFDSPKQYSTFGGRIKTDHTYGISASYAIRGWQIEAGANNLFLKPTTETWALSNVYRGLTKQRDKTEMSHGYVRLAYTFDFGKKLRHTNDGPDRSSESAILRAD